MGHRASKWVAVRKERNYPVKVVAGTHYRLKKRAQKEAYHDAYKKEFWTLRKPRTEHVDTTKLRGDMNNNKMERFNGEVRDREKVIRGLKKDDTPILKGYQLFHNYIGPHEGLDGKIPAEACGITVQGKNKWITLIQNAKRQVHKKQSIWQK